MSATLQQLRTQLDHAINLVDQLMAGAVDRPENPSTGTGTYEPDPNLIMVARQVVDAAQVGNYTEVAVSTISGVEVRGAIRPSFFDVIERGFGVVTPTALFAHGPHEEKLSSEDRIVASMIAGNGEMHQNRAALYGLGVHREGQWGRVEEIDPALAIASSRSFVEIARRMAGRALSARAGQTEVHNWLWLNDTDALPLAAAGF
jgi:hypothetical protein